MCASTVITHQHQCDSRVSVQFSSNNVFAVWYSRPCSSQTEKTGSLRTVVTICFKCLRCAACTQELIHRMWTLLIYSQLSVAHLLWYYMTVTLLLWRHLVCGLPELYIGLISIHSVDAYCLCDVDVSKNCVNM